MLRLAARRRLDMTYQGTVRSIVAGLPDKTEVRISSVSRGMKRALRAHRIMPGSHSASRGNATRMARRTTSAHMNGSTPLKTVAVLTSGSRVRSTNMFIPTGGLMDVALPPGHDVRVSLSARGVTIVESLLPISRPVSGSE